MLTERFTLVMRTFIYILMFEHTFCYFVITRLCVFVQCQLCLACCLEFLDLYTNCIIYTHVHIDQYCMTDVYSVKLIYFVLTSVVYTCWTFVVVTVMCVVVWYSCCYLGLVFTNLYSCRSLHLLLNILRQPQLPTFPHFPRRQKVSNCQFTCTHFCKGVPDRQKSWNCQ